MKSPDALVDPLSFVASRDVIFSEPMEGSVPNTSPAVKFHRLYVNTSYGNGRWGPLVLEGEECFSFGISENKDPATQNVTGHSVCISLIGRDGATERERAFVDSLQHIYELTKEHLVSENVKKTLKKPNMEGLLGLYTCPLRHVLDKQDNPTDQVRLYVRLIESKKDNRVVTKFYDVDSESDEPIKDPLEFLKDKRFYIKPAIKVESVFIGAKMISLQIKLHEAYVRLIDSSTKKLLSRPTTSRATNPMDVMSGDFEEDEPMVNADDDLNI